MFGSGEHKKTPCSKNGPDAVYPISLYSQIQVASLSLKAMLLTRE